LNRSYGREKDSLERVLHDQVSENPMIDPQRIKKKRANGNCNMIKKQTNSIYR
jgi:hypothetical protein